MRICFSKSESEHWRW